MIFEIVIYLLFGACLVHAWKRGLNFVTELFGGLMFGLILEYVNVAFLVDYRYGRFLVMIADIPLAIGVGWAVIIYTSMALSDRFGLNNWTRPMADAFLALNIDLPMDVIAIRLGDGMWGWGWADQSARWTSEWFGVPFGNFFGWFFVVFLYSATLRFARYVTVQKKLKNVWKTAYPFMAVVISEILLMSLIIALILVGEMGVPSWLIFVIPVAISAAFLVFFGKPKPCDSPTGWIIHAVPLFFHLYFLAAVIVFKLEAWTPWIIPISLSMLITGIVIHIFAFRSRNKNRIMI